MMRPLVIAVPLSGAFARKVKTMRNALVTLFVVSWLAACGAPVDSSNDATPDPTSGWTRDGGSAVTDGGDTTLDAGNSDGGTGTTDSFTPKGARGSKGNFFFDVRVADPGGLQYGSNTLLVTISTAKALVTKASIVSKAYMPSMGNMPSPSTPNATEQGNGVYKLEPVECSMGGTWEVVLDATGPDGTADRYKQHWDVN